MDIVQTKEFYQMQTEMKNLTKEQAEMRQEIREGFVRNDLKHEEMMNHLSQQVTNMNVQFGVELQKKADKDNSWAEKVWIALFGIVGAGLIGAVGYAIVRAYQTM